MDIPSTKSVGSYRKLTFIVLLLLVTFSSNVFAQVYKCKINGKIVYTNKVCPDNTALNLDLSKSSFSTTSSPSPGVSRKSTATSSKDISSRVNSPGWLHDKAGYQKALKASAKNGAPIFIYGYTDWCVYCKKLHKKLFDDSSVKKMMAGFIKVKINPEHSPEDKVLYNQWGGRGYPTLFTQAEAGSSPSRTKGPFTKINGKWKLMTKNEFIAMLRSRL